MESSCSILWTCYVQGPSTCTWHVCHAWIWLSYEAEEVLVSHQRVPGFPQRGGVTSEEFKFLLGEVWRTSGEVLWIAIHSERSSGEVGPGNFWGSPGRFPQKIHAQISGFSSRTWRNLPPHMGDAHGDPQTSPQQSDPHGFLVWFSLKRHQVHVDRRVVGCQQVAMWITHVGGKFCHGLPEKSLTKIHAQNCRHSSPISHFRTKSVFKLGFLVTGEITIAD